MPSRHILLAELEDARRKKEEEAVEWLSWERLSTRDASGHDPYDNPGAGKHRRWSESRGKRRRAES